MIVNNIHINDLKNGDLVLSNMYGSALTLIVEIKKPSFFEGFYDIVTFSLRDGKVYTGHFAFAKEVLFHIINR